MPKNNRLLTLTAAGAAMAAADGMEFDETIHLILNARTVHHDDPDFPVVAPVMVHSRSKKNCASIKDFNLVSDDKERRWRYHQGMKLQRGGRQNT